MTQDDPAFPMPPPLKRGAPKDPEYLVALDAATGIRAGRVVPNTPENAKALEGKSRPATDVDIGVAGIIRKV